MHHGRGGGFPGDGAGDRRGAAEGRGGVGPEESQGGGFGRGPGSRGFLDTPDNTKCPVR